MMLAKITGAIFGILGCRHLCLEIQGNTIMPTMNHAAFGFRRRVRCLLAG